MDTASTRFADPRSQARHPSRRQNFGNVASGPATPQSYDGSAVPRDARSEAVQEISKSAEFWSIAQKLRADSEWKKRRAAVVHIARSVPHLIPLLLEAPVRDNATACQLFRIFANFLDQSVPDLTTLLSIYTDNELPFFIAFKHLMDEEFLDCLQIVLQMVTTEARRQSSLQHLQAPPSSDVSNNQTGSRPGSDLSFGGQAVRVSADSTCASRPSSFDPHASSTVANTPSTVATPYGDEVASPQGHPQDNNVPRGPPHRSGPSTPSGSGTSRLHCHECETGVWKLDQQSCWARYRTHRIREHNEQIRWTCTHDKCPGKGKGKEDGSYLTHHHTRSHRECTGEPGVCPPPDVTTIGGKNICICLNCDTQPIFQGDDCYERLVDHEIAAHSDLILAGTLNENPTCFSEKATLLIRTREDLQLEFTRSVMNTYPVPEGKQVGFTFDHTDKDVTKLFRDLQFKIEGSAREIQEKKREIIRSFLKLGKAYCIDAVEVQSPTIQQPSHQHDMARAFSQLNHPQYPPRTDSRNPMHNGLSNATTGPPPWDHTQGLVNERANAIASPHRQLEDRDPNRMSFIYEQYLNMQRLDL